ncbi:hypothetical protein [Sphingomonas nostoxanthinifaciens]|uniref:hypothetical protein n=1 Tax=Sphingomonas nostoxanthinifaciens TaxID=2872652 RepID=UPI001CC1D16A|nr:hypothetical protein [Sphingomonas nostoxanthinifaciens]UAK23770.1 hypothetical protein K8P63_15500 [Sphingomonas nostoxanthinifaciens]
MVSRLFVATVAAALMTSPSLAGDIVVTGQAQTFGDLEFGYSGTDRIDAARSGLAASIPAGSSVASARALLVRAGARCKDAAPSQMRCTSNKFEAVEDMLHDVSWTVAVNHDGDAVTRVAVDRASIGS